LLIIRLSVLLGHFYPRPLHGIVSLLIRGLSMARRVSFRVACILVGWLNFDLQATEDINLTRPARSDMRSLGTHENGKELGKPQHYMISFEPFSASGKSYG
jgi:hypothetical protein